MERFHSLIVIQAPSRANHFRFKNSLLGGVQYQQKCQPASLRDGCFVSSCERSFGPASLRIPFSSVGDQASGPSAPRRILPQVLGSLPGLGSSGDNEPTKKRQRMPGTKLMPLTGMVLLLTLNFKKKSNDYFLFLHKF